MNGMTIPERIGPPDGRPTPKLRVVDLSERPGLAPDDPLPATILEAFEEVSSGILTKEEVLAAARGHPPSDAERAVQDLALRGLVRVVWTTPFRFLAVLRDSEGAAPPPVFVSAVSG